jgi:hypothetical protein
VKVTVPLPLTGLSASLSLLFLVGCSQDFGLQPLGQGNPGGSQVVAQGNGGSSGSSGSNGDSTAMDSGSYDTDEHDDTGEEYEDDDDDDTGDDD